MHTFDTIEKLRRAERRAASTRRPARALLEVEGVLPVIALKNTWAGWRDRVACRPGAYNRTGAANAPPVD